MTPSEFANKIRTKYPGQYDDISDQDLTSKTLAKYPEYSDMVDMPKTPPPTDSSSGTPMPWQMEKMQGLPKSPTDLIKQFGSQMLEGASSPMPGSLLTTPIRAMSQTAQQAGSQTSKDLIASGTNELPARAAGMGVSTLLDPITYSGGKWGTPQSGVESSAKGFLSTIKDKIVGMFTKPATDQEIGSIVDDMQNTLVSHRKAIGEQLGQIRGTSQPALDRLDDIAEKGTESPVSPQEAAKNIKEYFKNVPMDTPLSQDATNPLAQSLREKWVQATNEQTSLKPQVKGSYINPDDFSGGKATEYTPGTKPVQKGDIISLKSSNPNMPDIKAMHNGPHTISPNISYQLQDPIPETDPARIQQRIESDKAAREAFPNLPQMDLENMIRHPAGSDIPTQTLKEYGYNVPDRVPYESPKEELQALTKMKQDAYAQIGKKTLDQSGNIVPAISDNDTRAFKAGIAQINARMEQVPGGSAIRATEGKFSKIAGIYDDLQNKMDEPGQAQGFLRQIYNNPTGKNADYIDKLRMMDQLTGKNNLQALFEKFATQDAGISYSTLKHPIAAAIKQGLPAAGELIKGTANRTLPPATGIATRGFPLPQPAMSQLQSLKDRMNNAQ